MTDTALALIEPKEAAQYFTANGLDPIIEKIREQATGIVPDISTEKGRAEIRSLAFKVAKSKTALDEIGKNLAADLKKQTAAIDAERRRAWDAIEAIQHEVRAPLTEWENAEKERVAAHEEALAAIPEGPAYGQHEDAVELEVRLDYLENLPPRDWQEFSARAAKVLANEIERTRALLATAQQCEAEQAELARLRQEEADRRQREHEERIAAEAADKAQADAEAKAKAEADVLAAQVAADQQAAREREEAARREVEEAEARAKQAEAARLAAVAQAEQQARQAEADRKAAEERAERDRLAAAEQAKRDAELAAQRERDRIAAEQRAAEEAAAKREADKKHRAKIERDIYSAISDVGGRAGDIAHTAIQAIVDAIARGEIPHVRIVY